MSKYVQSSTENPSGRRPWQTRLYTGFEDYGFLKQPQNTILREDLTMRPEIYAAPDFKLGDATVVTGSGRVVQRGRRRRGLGLLPAMMDRSTYTGTTSIYRSPYVNAPIVQQRPLVTAPVSTMIRATEAPPVFTQWSAQPPRPLPIESPIVAPKPALTILPPSSVPAPPRAQTGTIYVSPAGFPAPSIAPQATLPTISTASAPSSSDSGSSAPAAAPVDVSTLSDWFNSSTWIAGVPNGYVAIGIVGAIFLFARKKR